MAADDPQAEVVAFLTNDGLGHTRPQRIDTHAASVFLTEDRAWKLKRAIKFDYLDFSTTQKRKKALETELLLNRRSAPNLYIGIHAVTRDETGRLQIDGSGDAIDWLLEMHRFNDDARLDQLAEAGRFTGPILIRLADNIHGFHSQTVPVLHHTGAQSFRNVIGGNTVSMSAFPGILDGPQRELVSNRQSMLVERFAALLDARARSGRVRHAHGDLHLANIAMIDNEPTLFDCLEFSTELATVDVLYDIAFLLMDLWHRGHRNEANVIFNRYLDLSPNDEDGIALMPLFLSVRAVIRAHVSAAQSARADGDATLANRARAYLRLADDILVPVPARLIAIGGLSGTGKSTLARCLGDEFGHPPGARILRSDVIRKRRAGVAPEVRLSEAYYGAEESAGVYRVLYRMVGAALGQGSAVIADAVFARPSERTAVGAITGPMELRFDGIWLVAGEADRIERVSARAADASDADATVARRQSTLNLGPIKEWHRLCSTGKLKKVTEVASHLLRPS